MRVCFLQVIFPIPIDIISNMMAKKRGDGPRGDDVSHQVRHQVHQGHQGDHGHQVRQQQLHQPAPLHQHQLQVKVGEDRTMWQRYWLNMDMPMMATAKYDKSVIRLKFSEGQVGNLC